MPSFGGFTAHLPTLPSPSPVAPLHVAALAAAAPQTTPRADAAVLTDPSAANRPQPPPGNPPPGSWLALYFLISANRLGGSAAIGRLAARALCR